MSRAVEVRCSRPHPSVSHWVCNGYLIDVIEDTVTIAEGSHLLPGCTRVKCKRCGTRYVICPAQAA